MSQSHLCKFSLSLVAFAVCFVSFGTSLDAYQKQGPLDAHLQFSLFDKNTESQVAPSGPLTYRLKSSFVEFSGASAEGVGKNPTPANPETVESTQYPVIRVGTEFVAAYAAGALGAGVGALVDVGIYNAAGGELGIAGVVLGTVLTPPAGIYLGGALWDTEKREGSILWTYIGGLAAPVATALTVGVAEAIDPNSGASLALDEAFGFSILLGIPIGGILGYELSRGSAETVGAKQSSSSADGAEAGAKVTPYISPTREGHLTAGLVARF